MIRFFVVFFVTLVSLFSARMLNWTAEHITVPFTKGLAWVSAHIMMLFDGDVHSEGIVIESLSSGKAVMIAPGCDGIEAIIILVAGIAAFPAPWRYKLKGLMYGFLAIQGMNLIRIISLFYLLQWNRVWFDWFHLYLWQALIVLDALAVFLIWLRYAPKPKRVTTNQPAA